MKKLPSLMLACIFTFSGFQRISAAIEDGLVAHWTFDNDLESVISDVSGNNLHGKGYNISYESGAVGKAVVFNNAQARIYFPDINLPAPASIASLGTGTISLWFKYKSLGAQILPILYFGESSRGTTHNSLIIEIGHGKGLDPANKRLYFTIVNQSFCFDSKENLLGDRWYHFAAVVSETGNTGYLNGKEIVNRQYNLGSNAGYTDFFSGVPVAEMLSLGYGRYGQEDPFYTFKGSIDEVRIYNRAITAEEAGELYKQGNPPATLQPTYSDVVYGPYDRNVLDFWKADSEQPTPLVVFIHGGGFTSGDKSQARSGVNLNYMQLCLENGISFAAINYRFKQTARLDTIMLDIARAIQFMRSKSETWNINKEKIAAYGSSAGGGASIWLAFNNDLADEDNPDPVLRESTRLAVAGHLNSQSTYDMLKWAEIVGVSENWMIEMNTTEDLSLYHIPDRTWYDSAEIKLLRQKLDMVSMIGSEDPPVYFQNMNANVTPATSGAVIHHPRHPIYLKSICDQHGIDNTIVLAVTPFAERVDMLDFFFKYLLNKPVPVRRPPSMRQKIVVFPNPAGDHLMLSRSVLNATIFDMQGNMRWTGSAQKGEVLNTSDLDNGIYLMRSDQEVIKFMISR